MNQHHKRITQRIIEEMEKYRDGKRSLIDIEQSIESHLDATDSTYPQDLRNHLAHFVQLIHEVILHHLDEPNENEEVEKKFKESINYVRSYLI